MFFFTFQSGGVPATDIGGTSAYSGLLKKRYPISALTSYSTVGTLITVTVQGAAGDVVTFPPLLNAADAASWDLPSENRDGYTTIEPDSITGVDSVHAIDLYIDGAQEYRVLTFDRSGSTYSVTLNSTYPYGSGLSLVLPDADEHDISIEVVRISGSGSSKRFRARIYGFVDVFTPSAAVQTS